MSHFHPENSEKYEYSPGPGLTLSFLPPLRPEKVHLPSLLVPNPLPSITVLFTSSLSNNSVLNLP